ncbi:hypothetical protein [Pseudonocardia sp. WMMC193]|uniref:hypothetical protein n=1 Tax=Pseudonocardia sp. WMMC193 TaxID=2911965 RepID=UPI001F49059D|nr:hypothetical protein [Pseudonocardia sp. WMMC193]MCF7548917.1 hypothetical protein [Pseudonocardia sp. WMMC193]
MALTDPPTPEMQAWLDDLVRDWPPPTDAQVALVNRALARATKTTVSAAETDAAA